MKVHARQLIKPELVWIGTFPNPGTEEGAAGDWLINDGHRQYLSSNRQFELLYEPTEIQGVYQER